MKYIFHDLLANINPFTSVILFFCVFGLFTPQASAQTIQSIPSLTGTVTLDGFSNESAWSGAAYLPVTSHQPVFGQIASEETEIRIGHDDAFVYISGRFHDSTPAGIRTNSLYRDQNSGDDTFTLILDTFNDNENALAFWTNPVGVRGDYAISSDGNSTNSNWNTYWDVAARKTEDGWFMEMRIPFSSLGFQSQDGRVEMGLIAYRYIARKNELVSFPALSPERSVRTPSRAQRVVLEGVYSRTPLYITPYFLAGSGKSAALNKQATRYESASDLVTDLGFDLKYNLTSNLTIDATVNTDFAQVEADNQQVNLSRFSLFFPEKRQFFQERSGLFQFGTLGSGPDRLFHSRRIGLNNNREVPVLGGARLVGKAGAWDIGFLNMQTARQSGIDLPSENFGVLRLRRQVINPYSFAGGLVTSRIDEDGGYNVAYGLDMTTRIFGDDYTTVKWAQTFDDGIIDGSGFDFSKSGMYQLQWTRRRNIGLNYWTSFTRAGTDFLPGMGFTTRRNFTEGAWYVSYDWLAKESSSIRQISPIQFWGFVTTRNDDGSVESALYEYDTDVRWKSGMFVWMDLEVHYEDLRSPLELPENTIVPVDNYTFFRMEGGGGLSSGLLFRPSVSWGISSFYGGKRFDAGWNATWNASPVLQFIGSYSYNRIRFPDRDQGFDAHIVQLRVRVTPNTRLSAHTFIQYSNTSSLGIANVRLRYNFREGHDLWFVYNEGFNTQRFDSRPALPVSNEQTFLLKYTYTFGS